MQVISCVSGATVPLAREYDIATGTAISAGQVVKVAAGKVVPAIAKETSSILGIAGEYHPGTADALNPRANGTGIMVFDDPGLIFECDAPVIEAASGSATTIVPKSGDVDATIADDGFNGYVLQLIEKASASTNTDEIGTLITVTDYTAEGTVITKASGGTPSAGDKYRVYPVPVSAVGGTMSLDSTTLSKLVVTAKGATALRCESFDVERGKVQLMAAKHLLAQ